MNRHEMYVVISFYMMRMYKVILHTEAMLRCHLVYLGTKASSIVTEINSSFPTFGFCTCRSEAIPCPWSIFIPISLHSAAPRYSGSNRAFARFRYRLHYSCIHLSEYNTIMLMGEASEKPSPRTSSEPRCVPSVFLYKSRCRHSTCTIHYLPRTFHLFFLNKVTLES